MLPLIYNSVPRPDIQGRYTSSIPGLGRGRMCEKFHQLLAVGRWFPPGIPVSSTRKIISSSSFYRLDMTLAVAEALNLQ